MSPDEACGVAEQLAKYKGGTRDQWLIVVTAYVEEREASVVDLSPEDVEVALRAWWHEDRYQTDDSPLALTELGSCVGGHVREAVLELMARDFGWSRIAAAALCAEVGEAPATAPDRIVLRRSPVEAGIDLIRLSLRVLERELAAGHDVTRPLAALREIADKVATELGRPSLDELLARHGRPS